jgi:tetratricopeptide (TPR) repeat protein
MVHADKIHKWLSHPESLTETEHKAIAGLTEKYPYCIPVRYLEAALEQKAKPFSPEMLGRMQLFSGNWLMYYRMLEQAAGIEPTPVLQWAPESQETMSTGDALTDAVSHELMQEQVGVPAGTDPVLPPGATSAEVPPAAASGQEVPQSPETAAPREKQEFTRRRPLADHPDPAQSGPAEELLQPVSADDYFLHQGIRVPDTMPEDPVAATAPGAAGARTEEGERAGEEDKDKSLMVVMSFSDWLMYFKTKSEKAREEEEGQKALKAMWQKEKLAAALEDEAEEIPETVFNMAVNSISREEDLASESLATILIRQGKYDKAIEMYRKLSLRNPQKSAYFARQIEKIQKEKEL